MKIIVEGADGTGKTTLVKLLAERYDLDICHCTQNDPADFDFYKQTARKENIVWDRHTIGELIYPNVFGRKQQIGIEDARLAIAYARENDGVVLILTADNEVIKKRLLSRNIPEDSRIIEKSEWINEQFIHFADLFAIPVIDTSKMTIEEIFNLVENEAGKYKLIYK